VELLPLPYAEAPATTARPRLADRRAVGFPRPARIDRPPYGLVMFGHIGSNRGLEHLIEALGQFPARDRFHLDVYGTVVERAKINGLIDAARLGGTVHLHGHVAEPVLESALASADLAVNLRFPSVGEASHSQLRIWSHSLPSIVTRTGWYAGLPDDTVLKIRPGHEVAEVLAHLRGFLRDPAPVRRMGEVGRRRLLERHDPRAYVAEVVRFAGEMAARRGPVAGAALAGRVRDTLKAWADDDTLTEHTLGVVDRTIQRLVA
jgi:glycosyltransferase involved in cell wall biosynthesis